MNWYKQADFLGRDPFKVDFAHEREMAKQKNTDELLYALYDAIEASQTSVNEGKYYDQASVYRQELASRGMDTDAQDEALSKLQSLHWQSQDDAQQSDIDAEMGRDTYQSHGDGYQASEDTSPCKDPNDRPRSNGKSKSYQKQPNLEQQNHYTANF